jgi:hypothetical protein
MHQFAEGAMTEWFWWFEMSDVRYIMTTAAGVFLGILAYQGFSAVYRSMTRMVYLIFRKRNE